MKLAIISHTEHYRNSEGEIVGWGPTVTEINHLIQDFEKIYHLAFFHPEDPPPSSLPYTSADIEFIALPASGGRNLIKKAGILTKMPATLRIIERTLKKVDVFQFRTPVGIGVYLIPWLSILHSKKGWYKYAGNWNQENPPLGFYLQRWMLKKQRRKVTINGSWQDQPAHCLTFENPCLTVEERKEGEEVVKNKRFIKPYSFCFVGRLEDEKGVTRILDAFQMLKGSEELSELHFIGDGPGLRTYQEKAKTLGVKVRFHKFVGRQKVFEIYKACHFLLLPSTASEGFPKVIAEAMNFGCIPIVSGISSIEQYVQKGKNGFIVNAFDEKGIVKGIDEALQMDEKRLREIVSRNFLTAALFTFARYREQIRRKVLNFS